MSMKFVEGAGMIKVEELVEDYTALKIRLVELEAAGWVLSRAIGEDPEWDNLKPETQEAVVRFDKILGGAKGDEVYRRN